MGFGAQLFTRELRQDAMVFRGALLGTVAALSMLASFLVALEELAIGLKNVAIILFVASFVFYRRAKPRNR